MNEPCRCVYHDKCFCQKEASMATTDPVEQLVEAAHALIDSLDYHMCSERHQLIYNLQTAIGRVEAPQAKPTGQQLLNALITPQHLDTKEDQPTPTPRQDPVRLLVLAGLAVGDTRPVVAVASDESVVAVDSTEWDQFVTNVRETWGADYEWREVVVLVPAEPLLAALERVEVQGEVE